RQVFTTEQHAHPISGGPGLAFTFHVPHGHHFNSRGGRVLPLYKDAQGVIPNLAPGLLVYLSRTLGQPISAENLLAYVAAVVSHPGYTQLFRKDLEVPGVRVPLSRDSEVWTRAISIGREVIWLHTYGMCFVDQEKGKPRLDQSTAPKITAPVDPTEQDMPDSFNYDEATRTLTIGTSGRIFPIPKAVWEYTVGGKQPSVVKRWVGYRLKRPRGHIHSSPLDEMSSRRWTLEFNNELLDLLHVIGRLVQLEPQQGELLEEIVLAPIITESELTDHGILPP